VAACCSRPLQLHWLSVGGPLGPCSQSVRQLDQHWTRAATRPPPPTPSTPHTHTHTRHADTPAPQGLSRLLELLFEWFNVTLGEMLVAHLRKALEPEAAGGLGTGRPGEPPPPARPPACRCYCGAGALAASVAAAAARSCTP
jgi:hypothetical protein